MSRQHNVKVSERMAERIKINVGAALTELGDDAPEDYIVHGPNRYHGSSDGSACMLPGSSSLSGEINFKDRNCYLECVGKYTS